LIRIAFFFVLLLIEDEFLHIPTTRLVRRTLWLL